MIATQHATAARMLREQSYATLADLATAMRVTNHEAAEFLRDPIVRDRLARMVGARRVSYTRSKRHLAYDRVEAVF